MKYLIPAVLAFVIGFVSGGYGPRRDLEKTKKELQEAREAASARPEAAAWASGISQMLAARATAPPPAPAHPTKADVVEPPPTAPPAAPDLGPAAPADGGDEPAEESFESMRAAVRLRSAKHRQALIEAAKLDGARARDLDAIIADLNTELSREAERAARRLEGIKGPPTTRNMVDVMVDFAQVYQRADDKLQRTLSPEEREAAARKKFDLTTQVDPESLRPLFEVVKKMDKSGGGTPFDEEE